MAPPSSQISTSHTNACVSFVPFLSLPSVSLCHSVHQQVWSSLSAGSPITAIKAKPPPPLVCPFSLFLPWHPTVLSHGAKEMGSYQYSAYSPSVLPNNTPEKIPALSHLCSPECPSQALVLHQLLCALSVPWQPQACAPPGTVQFLSHLARILFPRHFHC